VSEIIDAAFKEAVAVVVLLTPDDQVKLDDQFHKASDPSYEKRVVGQARPNVLFEAGMAFGRDPNSTVLVQVGDVKPFSDVGGRHVTRLTNDVESRSELVTKLRNAGCFVDDGGTDWYSIGDFTA
jgi:predicted nucleotide-binding protein